jgi:hypothetical protein
MIVTLSKRLTYKHRNSSKLSVKRSTKGKIAIKKAKGKK